LSSIVTASAWTRAIGFRHTVVSWETRSMRIAVNSGLARIATTVLGLVGCSSTIVCEGPSCEEGGGGTSPSTTVTSGGGGDGGVAAVGGFGGAGPICGNGVAEPGEDCDGADVPEEPECASAFCSADCVLDESACQPFCGDGLVSGEELCDGAQLAGATCEELVPDSPGGDLACSPDCQSYDVSSCTNPSNCGNGVLDPGETCDGMNFGGLTCASFGFGFGELVCNASCNIVANLCSSCGNGVIDASEQCDGMDLQGQSCVALGYGGGVLACSLNCSYDVAGCTF
jgi:hypothetical protein